MIYIFILVCKGSWILMLCMLVLFFWRVKEDNGIKIFKRLFKSFMCSYFLCIVYSFVIIIILYSFFYLEKVMVW